MKINKSDALLIHSTLYMAYNAQDFLSEDYRSQVGDILDDLNDYLVESDGDSVCHHSDAQTDQTIDDDYEEDDEEEEDECEEEEEPQPEELVSSKDAADLPPIIVVSPSGSKVTLEFEDVGEEHTVDALLDDGGIIIDSVSCVVLGKEEISLYDGEGWHDFKVKKIPKQWSKFFTLGKTTGFDSGEDE